MSITAPAHIVIACDYCPQRHRAEYSHEGEFNEGPIYTAVCTADPAWYEDNYTLEAAVNGSETEATREAWEHVIAGLPLA